MQKKKLDPKIEEKLRQAKKNDKTPASRAASEPKSVISPRTKFKGDISGEEDVIIHGHFEGSIALSENKLYIGEQGSVKGDVVAKNIYINGSVNGQLNGKESIILRASSQVVGDIKAERVSLEDGARFKGSIEMDFYSQSDDAPEEAPPQF